MAVPLITAKYWLNLSCLRFRPILTRCTGICIALRTNSFVFLLEQTGSAMIFKVTSQHVQLLINLNQTLNRQFIFTSNYAALY